MRAFVCRLVLLVLLVLAGNAQAQQLNPAGGGMGGNQGISFPGVNNFTGNFTGNVTGGNINGNVNGVLYANTFSGSDIMAQAQNAQVACPTNGCEIHIPAGSYNASTSFAMTKPGVVLVGDGSNNTQVTLTTGSGPLIKMAQGCASPYHLGGVIGITFVGNSTANAVGIKHINTCGAIYDDLVLRNFTGTGGIGIWLDNEPTQSIAAPNGGFSERVHFGRVSYINNTNGKVFTNTVVASVTASISGTTMTVTAVNSGGPLAVGQFLYDASNPNMNGAYYISALGTGTGGVGTYTLQASPGTIASEIINLAGNASFEYSTSTDEHYNVYDGQVGIWVHGNGGQNGNILVANWEHFTAQVNMSDPTTRAYFIAADHGAMMTNNNYALEGEETVGSPNGIALWADATSKILGVGSLGSLGAGFVNAQAQAAGGTIAIGPVVWGPTKTAAFQGVSGTSIFSNATTGRVWTLPDNSDTFAGLLNPQTFTGAQTMDYEATTFSSPLFVENTNSGAGAGVQSVITNGTDDLLLFQTGHGYTSTALSGGPAGISGGVTTTTAEPLQFGINNVTGFYLNSANHLIYNHAEFVTPGTSGAACFTTGLELGYNTANCIPSSLRFKKDIHPIEDALATVDNLSRYAIYYHYKHDDNGPNSRYEQPGFGAEWVAQADPRYALYDKAGNPSGIRYEQLAATEAVAIKQLDDKVNELQAQLAARQTFWQRLKWLFGY